jgi:hypothetical protein
MRARPSRNNIAQRKIHRTMAFRFDLPCVGADNTRFPDGTDQESSTPESVVRVILMARRLAYCLLLILGVASNLFAGAGDPPQPPMFKPPALAEGPVNAAKVLADRISFVKEMYKLNDEQAAQVPPALDKLLPEQEQYQAKTELTLRRLQLAYSLAISAQETPETDRAVAIAKFQEQVNKIHAAAPLSFANVMKAVDPLFPKDQVAAARTRIAAELATRTKGTPAGVDLSKMDLLLGPPIVPEFVPEMPAVPNQAEWAANAASKGPEAKDHPAASTPPTAAAEQPAAPQSGVIPQAAPGPQPATTQPVAAKPTPPPQPAGPPTPPPPARPPKVLPPAPPEAEWTRQYEAKVNKYGLGEEQKKVAEQTLKNVLARAASHREKSKGDYEQAAKMTDPNKKAEALRNLDKTLDALYDELHQRLDSIATIEQRMRAEGRLIAPRKTEESAATTQPQGAVTPSSAPTPRILLRPGPAPAAPTPPGPQPTTAPAQAQPGAPAKH